MKGKYLATTALESSWQQQPTALATAAAAGVGMEPEDLEQLAGLQLTGDLL